MKLYWASGSPFAWRAMLGLTLKGLAYNDHLLSLSDREHKSPHYTAINPRGQVPTLVDGEVVVSESLAILAYLDRAFPSPPLFGASAFDAAAIWQAVMDFENHVVKPGQPVVRALFFGKWMPHVDDHKLAMSRVLQELDRLDGTLDEGAPNGLDCVLLPFVKGLERAKLKAGASNVGLLPLDVEARWPAISRRIRQVEALPGYDRTYPPHWR